MKYLALVVILTLAACGGSTGGEDSLKRGTLVAESIGKVPGPGACGVSNAYRVTEAAGVKLRQPATLRLATARRLDGWLRTHAVPIIGNRGGGLVGIQVPAHYVCKTRNSRRGARLSEHAKGNAIDISGITLRNGTTLSLERDWRRRSEGAVLKRLHRAACGPFGTVLGPDADRFHQDHFHFDTKRRRNPYCR